MKETIFQRARVSSGRRAQRLAEKKAQVKVVDVELFDSSTLGCFLRELKTLIVQHRRSQLHIASGNPNR